MIDPELYDIRLVTTPELAAIITQVRVERGWSQATLAELARIS